MALLGDHGERHAPVIATCAWGRYHGELAALSHNQFVLSDDDP